MKLYDELAKWWPLFSAPEDYAEEAAFFARVLTEACEPAPRTVLELGSGGGNNALYLESKFEMTLVNLSSQMLAVSRALNPECEHREGDMRTVSLGRTFDAVFVHDAISYMRTKATCEPAVVVPIGAVAQAARCRAGACVTFMKKVQRGGHDGDGRSLRYLMWTGRSQILQIRRMEPTARSCCATTAGMRASCTILTSRDSFRAPNGFSSCMRRDLSRAS